MSTPLSALVPEFPLCFPENFELLTEMFAWHRAHRAAPADLRDDDRRRYNLGCVRINHPVWDATLDTGLQLVTEPSNDIRCLLLEGPPRVGKTSATCELAMRVCAAAWRDGTTYVDEHGTTHRIVAVLFVKAAYSEAKDFMRDCLRALGYRDPRGTANDLLSFFVDRCRVHRVQLIVIDDLHNAGDRVATLPNFYKRLIDRLAEVTFIFTAVDFSQSPLRRPEDCPPRSPLRQILGQVWERATHVRFQAVDVTDDTQLAMFWDTLQAQLRQLRLQRHDAFDDIDPAIAIALLQAQDFKLGGTLARVAQGAARAVGTTEHLGRIELGLPPSAATARVWAS